MLMQPSLSITSGVLRSGVALLAASRVTTAARTGLEAHEASGGWFEVSQITQRLPNKGAKVGHFDGDQSQAGFGMDRLASRLL